MRRHRSILAVLVALPILSTGLAPARAQPQGPASDDPPAANPAGEAEDEAQTGGAESGQASGAGDGSITPAPSLPLAPAIKGERPQSDPSVLPPAASELPEDARDLTAPPSLALPDDPSQVRIRQLRPLGLAEVETIVEVNNPSLGSAAEEVRRRQSLLRAEISRWYPTIDLSAASLPRYTAGQEYNSAGTPVGLPGLGRQRITSTSITTMQAALELNWALIDPARTPSIAAARDEYEQAKNAYLIQLRDLRLQASTAYFDLQQSDDQVRIGQESVRASLISLRDARARYQAGVATRLEVLEAETQLARDQQLLTNGLASQAIARRALATLLNLPQNVTPTARDASRVVGTWLPTLQESIIAAYAFREELDQFLLDISIANSNANRSLSAVQPSLSIFNVFGVGSSSGYSNATDPVSNEATGNYDNAIGLDLRWRLFDGGRARAEYRAGKQQAEISRFNFADQRDAIRQQVEESFYQLEQNNRNIATTAKEVLSTRESLRLARLRFQAGVTTQREVVDTQRDLTQAEVRYANAISDYNKQLAQLRRSTGLDQIALCPRPSLPATRPPTDAGIDIPVEPQPMVPACSSLLTQPASGSLPDGGV